MEKIIDRVPSFSLSSYQKLMVDARGLGFLFSNIASITELNKNTIYIRHDVDFSVLDVLGMAEIESYLNISATYYVLLGGGYNIHSSEVKKALRYLLELGHDIGFHYDLKEYPISIEEGKLRLAKEIEIVEDCIGSKITSIVMHEPFRGKEDFFSEGFGNIINPAKFQNRHGVCYVSDSCRAWRDTTLIDFFNYGKKENIMQLNIHPELWLSEKSMNRISYLENYLVPKLAERMKGYYLTEVRNIWQTHTAAVSGFGDDDEM